MPSEQERALLAQAPFDEASYQAAIGAGSLVGEAGYTTLERKGVRPCLEVNGIWGGYTQEGFKTVLPAQAHAKLSVRLVPGQCPEAIAQACRDYFLREADPGLHVEVNLHAGGSPALVTDYQSKATQAALHAFQEVWGVQPALAREGGSIPILSSLQAGLQAPVTFLGFGLDSDRIHAPDEHFHWPLFSRGVATTIAFYHHYAAH